MVVATAVSSSPKVGDSD
jgi:hypothetical protein